MPICHSDMRLKKVVMTKTIKHNFQKKILKGKQNGINLFNSLIYLYLSVNFVNNDLKFIIYGNLILNSLNPVIYINSRTVINFFTFIL